MTAERRCPPAIRGAHVRTWPCPYTTYLTDVSSRRPMGPRACSFWVEMPTSAPSPSSPAVDETGRGVHHHRRRVDLAHEAVAPPRDPSSRWPRSGRRSSAGRGRWRRRGRRRQRRRASGRGTPSRSRPSAAGLTCPGAKATARRRPRAPRRRPRGRRRCGGGSRRATSAWTTSDSAALQTLGRWVLALRTMRSAMSRSAAAST